MTAMTSVQLLKPVSTDQTIKSDSVLTNPNSEAGGVVCFFIKLKHKVILSIFANWFLPKALLKIYIKQTTLKHGIMALRHSIENWKVSGSNRTSLSVFSIWKPLRVLQKAWIKIIDHAIYTYLFFSSTYTLLFSYKLKSSYPGLHKLHARLWPWM